MRPVLANLGFVLQFAGLLMLLPILSGFYFDEIKSLTSFFITTFIFFAAGFLLNVVAERKVLDFKSASILMTSTFFLLGLVGSIPYFYLNIFSDSNILSRFTNSYFESISGYTTTGLSLLTNMDNLPRSLLFYRSMTHWVGGLGIVFILVTFFYPESVVERFGRVLGIEKIGENIKKTFVSILLVYSVFIVLFAVLNYYVGISNLFDSIDISFASLMTGGFSPVSDFSKIAALSFNNYY